MRYKIIPIIAGAVALSSCSTAYRSSQTPDDVYYSPAKEIKVTEDNYNTDNSDDSYLRMKAHNYALWSSIDDYTYWNDSRYDFGYSCTPSRFAFISSINIIYPFGWGYQYGLYGYGWYGWNSPHSTVVYYKNPRVYYGSTNNTNLTAYRNNMYNNHNTYNQTNFGGLFRRAFSSNNTNTYNNGNNNNPSRTFNTGTNTSNSAGGRSGGYHSSGSSSSAPRTSRPPL